MNSVAFQQGFWTFSFAFNEGSLQSSLMNRYDEQSWYTLILCELLPNFGWNLLAFADILDHEQRPDKHARMKKLMHKILPNVYLSLHIKFLKNHFSLSKASFASDKQRW